MALVVLTGLVVISDATQIMRRPPQYKNRPNTFAMERQPKVHTLSRRATGKANFAYFTNWGIYGANFHILYSFADTDASTGAIKLTDPYSDEQKRFPGDTWTETGNNLYGCLKQLYLLKMKKRDLKVLLSIGGWTYSQAGHFNFVTNPTARAKFISDAVQLIEDYGFDGIDIDYEYPSTPEQGQGLADLVTSLRTALTQLASRKGESNPYLITAAVGAGPAGYSNLKVAQMDRAMDYWNLMAYDYAGSWLTWADNQANFYGGARTGYSTDAALKWYISQGATKSKINVVAGGQVYENKTDMTSYSYDPVKRELVSYDTPNIVRMKAIYVEKNGLGGTMFWELSTDKVGSESLVAAAASRLGALDSTPNHIKFPNSKWDNIRNNMSGGGSTTTAPAPTPTGGTPAPTGGPCAGVSAWSATTIYTGGNRATYSGRLWTARWWTQGETPGTAEVWTNSGAC
ncbi:class V chitinase ChiB1 [Coprinopsis cinerea okayama7|uniref:Class V chitinase ChiB1 n=1 Tax=Coprinopsis cinerea (strain Okayama-7 / 130 / ATCC MYA-4618 / FGSC 9003) TaxID=240176 RepID=A8NN10_COPC7|nr:class V chitinase ChiB1 [Coprinopsis cinerea okayama7\|eukprot:XP_001835030.2 class V chitinase ChiB1 [Coprinopsis cinerea okayama7\